MSSKFTPLGLRRALPLLDIATGLSVGPIVAKDGRGDVTEKCHDVAGTCCVWPRCARGVYLEMQGR